MDISGIPPRSNVDGASVDTAPRAAPTHPSETNAGATSACSIETPAATQHLSTVSLLLSLLREYETSHPGDAHVFLRAVADKLRSGAAQLELLAPGLNAWAAKLENAAETGDLSNLFPNVRPAAHFGIHAYQVAQQTAEDPAVTDAMVGHRAPSAGSAPTTVALDALSSELIRVATESLASARLPIDGLDRYPHHPHAADYYAAYVGRRAELVTKRIRRRYMRRHRGRRWRNRE